MALKLVTAAAIPLTLARAKRHLRTTEFSDDDDYIESLIEVAWHHINGAEGWMGRSLAQSTWQLLLDEFPDGDDPIRIPLPPLQSVDELEYADHLGATQTLTTFREFAVGAIGECGYIVPAYDYDWPDTLDDEREAVRITFTAGYSALPKPVEQAMLLMVGDWYEHREDAGEMKLASMPRGAASLLAPYRNWQ